MLRLAILIGILTGGGWLGLGEFERRSVYPFDPTRVSPAAAGLTGVTERLMQTGGESLILWVAPPCDGRPTILYFHGNAGNLANRADRFDRLIARGYGLIAPAYRGSSGSTGTPSEKALTADAQAVYDNLGAFIPDLTPARTILYGESLGTGVALKLVATRAGHQPLGVILEAPYSSIPDIVRQALPHLRPLLWTMTNRWISKRHARRLTAPLFILHGTHDTVIPIAHGRVVYDAAGSADKHFLPVPGAGHSDTWRSDTRPRLWQFIDRLGP